MKALLLIGCSALLTACSTAGTAVRIGANTYAPTAPEKIVLLVAPPEQKHEVIALVEGTAATDDYFTKARTEAAALEAMRKKAAELGADAIVLTGKGSQPYGQVTVGSGVANTYGNAYGGAFNATTFATTTSSSVGWEKITFNGTAIKYAPSP